jgi:hypothetical protein
VAMKPVPCAKTGGIVENAVPYRQFLVFQPPVGIPKRKANHRSIAFLGEICYRRGTKNNRRYGI